MMHTPKKHLRPAKVPKVWTMPEWMERYRPYLGDYGLGVEDLMNDHDSTLQNNDYRALVIVGLKEQVRLLQLLYNAGLVI